MSGMSETQGQGGALGQGRTPAQRQSEQPQRAPHDGAPDATREGAFFDAVGYAGDGDELATGDADQMVGVVTLSEARRRAQTRQLIREFLRAVPRAEPETPLAFLRADGEARVIRRRELSAAIDRLRPRQRQIVRLGIEERWPRQKVCAYLRNISIKTFERDQVEALDILSQL